MIVVGVPDELAVVGHDDSPLAAMFVPSISSVRLDPVELGRYFADVALHAVEGRPLSLAEPRIDVTVMARESTTLVP